MADEGNSAHVSSPSQDLNLEVKEAGVSYHQQEFWYNENNELIDTVGPSSVEVQADLSDSPRSLSPSSHLDDFNDSASPSNPLPDTEIGENLDIMGIANTWQDDEYCHDPAVPSRGGELSCLGLGQSANSGREWIGPSILPNDLFEEDRESICELLGDVPDSNSTPGVCGLRNLGNTCFMNAGLQCLINTHPLLNYFNVHSIEEQYKGCNSVHLTAQFAAFILKMWSGRFSTLRPAEFKHTLSLYHPQFKDYRQHDCQEFLALLLDSLHEHLSQTAEKNGSSGSQAVKADSAIGRDADLPPECCLLTMTEEPMELYESSRSSQLSSPRSSSDSVETTSSCTTSCSSTRAKAAALSLRSLPIPEEVKQPLFPLTIPPSSQDGSVTDLLFKGSPLSPQKNSLVMERNMLNPSPDPGAPPVLEKNLLSEISSMMKDSKTANVNISMGSAEASANNEIYFDSGKFPPLDPAKPRAAVASTRVHNTDCGQPLSQQQQQMALAKSKVKNTNVLKEAAKRLSEDQNLPSSSSSPVVAEAAFVGCQSLPSPNNENVTSISKKARFESGDGWQSQASSSHVNGNSINGNPSPWDSLGALGRAVKDEEPMNRCENVVCLPASHPKESVVTQTFQGQFRSTVVCCTCKHVSITYEPFMYLSVPLPRALERPVEIVFVPESGDIAPSRHHLVLQQFDEVSKLRQMLVKVLDLNTEQSERLVLAEVANRAIFRILEDKVLLRHVTDGQHRTVYAFVVPHPPAAALTPPGLANESSSSTSPTNSTQMSQDGSNPSQSDEPVVDNAWKSCAICLEEFSDSNLRKHTSCSCLLCQSCIEASCRHHQSNEGRQGGDCSMTLTCPVCSMDVNPEEEFAPLDKLHQYRPIIRHFNIPILLRLSGSPRSALGTHLAQSSRLIGYPRLLHLPNLISPKGLFHVVEMLYPQVNGFDLCFVDSQGLKCPRCLYPVRCNGCKIRADEDQVSLQPGDCLAVQVYMPEEEEAVDGDTAKLDMLYEPLASVEQDDCISSTSSSRNLKEPLTLDDCLRAFSESETLDEGNPWFCPKCQKSQCASKTLSISQPPPYLIVYLKRFVFHDNSSSKLDNRVEFPLSGLNLQPYVASVDISSNSDNTGDDCMYDLYGVVCHFGSASSGHYTAYTRHVNSKDWHYYNDETVLSRQPQEEDFSHGYVLFYQRRETSSSSSSCLLSEETVAASVSDK